MAPLLERDIVERRSICLAITRTTAVPLTADVIGDDRSIADRDRADVSSCIILYSREKHVRVRDNVFQAKPRCKDKPESRVVVRLELACLNRSTPFFGWRGSARLRSPRAGFDVVSNAVFTYC